MNTTLNILIAQAAPATAPQSASPIMAFIPLIVIALAFILLRKRVVTLYNIILPRYKSWSQKRQKQTVVAAPSSFRQTSGFDFRNLAAFIMILGIVALVYGFIQFSGNEPEQHVQASPTPDHGQNMIASMLDSQTRSMQAQDANMQIDSRNYVHAQAQDTAKKVMIAGAVVLFLGIGVASSARK